MTFKFKKEHGNWTEYRARFNLSSEQEIDFHDGPLRNLSHWEAMFENERIVLERLREAQDIGHPHLLFRHGWSTSGPGRTTARSVVRGIMRSKKATPFIVRAGCIEHDAVFLAEIRPKLVLHCRG
jgi:hypothetical protein